MSSAFKPRSILKNKQQRRDGSPERCVSPTLPEPSPYDDGLQTPRYSPLPFVEEVENPVRLNLAVGSQVKVLGIRGSKIENWFGVVEDDSIQVQTLPPFSRRRVVIRASQVLAKSDGWNIGSRLVTARGSFVVFKTPKISLSWLKEAEDCPGLYDTIRYQPKVEIEAMSKNVNVCVTDLGAEVEQFVRSIQSTIK